MGSFQANVIAGSIASLGIVLSAGYTFWLYNRICFGTTSTSLVGFITDVNRREFMILLTLLTPMLIFGLAPNIVLTDLHYAVSTLIYTD